MANFITVLFTFFIPMTITLFLFCSLVTATYYQKISPTQVGFKEEKLTHIHFYFHEIISSPKPSILIAVNPLKEKSKCPLPFGSIVALEDPLTVGPELDSKLVGKAQGFYVSVAQTEGLELELVMSLTFAFTEGEYNGSTISVMGRNTIFSEVREMPITGGTGAFRFARGFVQARSHWVDYLKGDAIIEYNVYVFHYSFPTSSSSHKGFKEDAAEFMTDPLLGKI